MYIVAIGDIHGCYKQLMDLMDAVRRFTYREEQVLHIFLGDYVDRGPDPKAVLDYLMKQQEEHSGEVICLKGNHEDNLVKCYYGGDLGTKNYSYNNSMGGASTLKSFGVETINDIPKKYIDWMAALPTWVSERPQHWGDKERVFVHAGINRKLPTNQQTELTCLWDRDLISEAPIDYFQDEWKRLVVHGHTPRHYPEYTGGRVNVDTGCVFGFDEAKGYGDSDKALTAAVFTEERPGPVKFINHKGIYKDV